MFQRAPFIRHKFSRLLLSEFGEYLLPRLDAQNKCVLVLSGTESTSSRAPKNHNKETAGSQPLAQRWHVTPRLAYRQLR